MADKIFVGNGKEHVFDDGGSIVKLGFSKKDIQTMINNINDNGYCNLVLNRRKQASEHGDTHYMKIDTWRPSQKNESQYAQKGVSASNGQQSSAANNFDDDIPF